MGTSRIDVVIHIDENLDDARIHSLERGLGDLEGVFSACVNDKARHLMLIDYDPENIRAQDLLHHVQGNGVHAELIGL